MKSGFVLALTLGVSCFAYAADTNPDQAESDAAYALVDSFTIKASTQDVSVFPAKLKCGDEKIKIASLFPTDGLHRTVVFVSAQEPDGIMVDFRDGDQVEILKFNRADLAALKAGQVASIQAIEINGYWWADGDHVTAGTVDCR